MSLPLPEVFQAALTTDRLEIVAQILIDEHFSTLTDLQSDHDDGYTRGCARFGRQRNRLRSVALSKRYDWFDLLHGGNDLVFTIGQIPCRFTTDDPLNPTKPAVLEASSIQRSFFEEVEAGTPCKFCFILDGGYGEADDPQVVFIGEDAAGNVRCKWASGGVRALHIIAADTPPAKDIGKARVEPKRADSDKAENSGTA
ncbi:hypothetical protein [Bordetella bronchiseptica]|uniref:hypothetical protein n=1 Tax=Bordetella bronchiseptica TaxID=518 RepID=UPI00028B4301|nr:hypothetical protein [Bordetella bronchiseptica]CCJ60586.1 conserved hypothetical protein [Bordetella bronchiseptica MO149]